MTVAIFLNEAEDLMSEMKGKHPREVIAACDFLKAAGSTPCVVLTATYNPPMVKRLQTEVQGHVVIVNFAKYLDKW